MRWFVFSSTKYARVSRDSAAVAGTSFLAKQSNVCSRLANSSRSRSHREMLCRIPIELSIILTCSESSSSQFWDFQHQSTLKWRLQPHTLSKNLSERLRSFVLPLKYSKDNTCVVVSFFFIVRLFFNEVAEFLKAMLYEKFQLFSATLSIYLHRYEPLVATHKSRYLAGFALTSITITL